MIVTAIPAGFAAGLFGIGGGLITVPILFYIFSALEIEPVYLMHLYQVSNDVLQAFSKPGLYQGHQQKLLKGSIIKNKLLEKIS